MNESIEKRETVKDSLPEPAHYYVPIYEAPKYVTMQVINQEWAPFQFHYKNTREILWVN